MFNNIPDDVCYGKELPINICITFTVNGKEIPYNNEVYIVKECGICGNSHRAYSKVSPRNETVENAIIANIEQNYGKLLCLEEIIKQLKTWLEFNFPPPLDLVDMGILNFQLIENDKKLRN